jgi:2-phosphosulfolactate phosphatase
MIKRKPTSVIVSIATPAAVVSTSYPLDGVIILIDALRASATVCCLFHQGAKQIRVTDKVEQARTFKAENPDLLACGERGGVKLAGFDLGNSPTEVLASDLSGKGVIFTSSNFTYRLVAAQRAKALLVGTSINVSTCCENALSRAEGENCGITIVPAGHTDAPFEEAEEDWAAASLLAQNLVELGAELGEETEEKVAHYLKRIEREGLSGIFNNSRHGRILASMGYAEDVAWCAGIDVLPVLPALSNSADGLPLLVQTA